MAMRNPSFCILLIAVLITLSCSFPAARNAEEEALPEQITLQPDTPEAEEPIEATATYAVFETPPDQPFTDKWSLWTSGTQLRGANIWSRVVVPELDGDEFLGNGYVGPPYTQADFDALAALGANYVNLSHPGLFSESPPYVLDEAVQNSLDSLLEMATNAHLFAVITFRTGPGRSDFTFYRDGSGVWFDEELLKEWVWSDPDAQDAWAEMWRYTAERYRDNPVVVGYDLMCEPNSNDVALGFYEPADFYPQYAGSLYDWNQFYPHLVEAIRQVDQNTPILVSAMSWGNLRWLPYLQVIDDPKIVYVVHQYEPQQDYTHQEPPAHNTYPGEFDLNWDGEPDTFNRSWLEGYLSIIADFQNEHGAPVSVNEFGVKRWVPGAAEFMQDELDIFEGLGINYALWAWSPDWKPYSSSVNELNFLLGPDVDNIEPVNNALMDVIVSHWQRNNMRP